MGDLYVKTRADANSRRAVLQLLPEARRPGLGVGQHVAWGQSRSRICDMRRELDPFAPVPARSQTVIAPLSGSSPCFKMTFSDMRTFTPITISALSATLSRRRRPARNSVAQLGHREGASGRHWRCARRRKAA